MSKNKMYDTKRFAEMIERMMKKYTNKSIGLNLLRKIKATHINNMSISAFEKSKLAEKMFHNLSQNDRYAKLD